MADRLDTDPELVSDPLDRAVVVAQLLAQLADSTHRPLLLSIAVPTRARLA